MDSHVMRRMSAVIACGAGQMSRPGVCESGELDVGVAALIMACCATLGVVPSDWDLVGRVALAFALTFVIGFERELRGGPAGDRTYSLVGMAAAAIAAIAVTKGSANAIAGVVTGVGFIGAALVFRGEGGVLRGITSASAVLATAAVGVAAGAGYPILALLVAAAILLSLEIRFLPVLRFLDARRYVGSVRADTEPPGPVRGRRSQGDPSS